MYHGGLALTLSAVNTGVWRAHSSQWKPKGALNEPQCTGHFVTFRSKTEMLEVDGALGSCPGL